MGATNTLYFCLNSQTRLDSILAEGSNPVTKTKDTLGTLSALMSQTNKQGFEAVPIQFGGLSRPSSTSNRKVAVSGRVKKCPTVVTEAIDYCAGTTAETSDLIDTEIQVGNPRGVTLTINRALYRDTCDAADGNAAGVIAYKMAEAAQSILEREDLDAVTYFLANTTTYFDGTNSDLGAATKTIPLYASSVPRVPQPGNLFLLINEYNRKGYNVAPIAVGGTGLARWAYEANFWIGNNEGSDISRNPGGLLSYVDYQVDSIANATAAGNYLISWIPGHFQMFHWLDFAEGSPLRRSNGEITKTTMNFGGEMFDVVVYDSNCDDNVDVTVSRWSQPWLIPSTFFSTTCGGEQSPLLWKLDCADTTCDNYFIPGNIIT